MGWVGEAESTQEVGFHTVLAEDQAGASGPQPQWLALPITERPVAYEAELLL